MFGSATRDRQVPAEGTRQARRALSAARAHLQKAAPKLLGWLVFAFLLLKLVPSLSSALTSLEHVRWMRPMVPSLGGGLA